MRRETEGCVGRAILLGELVARVASALRTPVPEVESYEDWSEVDFVRVHNADGTFELFQLDTTPTTEELILQVLAASNIAGVETFEIAVDRHVVSARERLAKQLEIARKYGLPDDLTAQVQSAAIDETLRETAWVEREQWFDSHMSVQLLP
jgi:hypothetical protein